MKINNLGAVKKADISLSDMTIFFGENGTGKTYTSYAIFGILDFLSKYVISPLKKRSKEIDDLLNKKAFVLDYSELRKTIYKDLVTSLNDNMINILSQNFNQPEDKIANFEIHFSESDLKSIVSLPTKTELKKSNVTLMPIKIIGIDNFNEDALYQLEIVFSNGFINVNFNELFIDEDEERFFNNRSYKTMFRKYKQFEGISQLVEYINVIFNSLIYNIKKPIYIPAERIGINVFRKEINKNRLSTLDALSEKVKSQNNLKLARKGLDLYPNPISSYIRNLNDWHDIYNMFLDFDLEFDSKFKSDSSSDHLDKAKDILSWDLLKGTFSVDEEEDEVTYINHDLKNQIPFQLASSTIKSLLGIDFYLNSGTSKGDYLIIDEPELNLHPKSQKKLASMLFEIMKSGIHVIISTHSDYLIREIINLEYKEKISHLENETKKYNIVAYDFVNNTAEKISDLTAPAYLKNFDEVTEQIEDEYYELLDKFRELDKENS